MSYNEIVKLTQKSIFTNFNSFKGLFLIFRNINIRRLLNMKQNNLLLNISDQQLQQAGLTRAQARKSLAALDYRDNDVFRHVMNAENPVSRKKG